MGTDDEIQDLKNRAEQTARAEERVIMAEADVIEACRQRDAAEAQVERLRVGMQHALETYDRGYWIVCRNEIAALLATPVPPPPNPETAERLLALLRQAKPWVPRRADFGESYRWHDEADALLAAPAPPSGEPR